MLLLAAFNGAEEDKKILHLNFHVFEEKQSSHSEEYQATFGFPQPLGPPGFGYGSGPESMRDLVTGRSGSVVAGNNFFEGEALWGHLHNSKSDWCLAKVPTASP